jgi:predicted PurR-regulated permease PerM
LEDLGEAGILTRALNVNFECAVAKASSQQAWQRALVILTGTVVAAVVVTCLVWARALLIPLALAIVLTFLLSPLVAGLQRIGLKRMPAVAVAVLLATTILGGLIWLVTSQVTGLLGELPQYTGNITAKIRSVQEASHSSIVQKLERMVTDIQKSLGAKPENPELAPETEPGPSQNLAPAEPMRVVVQRSTDWLAMFQWSSYAGSLGESLGGAGLTMVLVIFMLLRREDLRNRMIRLIGSGHITGTTRAVDDAAKRVSRYLLMQAVVNGSYGLVLAAGLWLIGVKYALLWGFLAGVLRYVPYVGTLMASIFPITLSLAMFEGWLQPLLVLGVILLIELVTYMLAEPLVYGQSIGVSEVALLLSAAFWTFLWGPIGLVLSNPLTVCLVVLGRHVRSLEFLGVLLGDEPALEPSLAYYQRLLARDQDEAMAVVLKQIKAASPEVVYDEVLVPALICARSDRDRDNLTAVDEDFVLKGTGEILEDLGEHTRHDPEMAATGEECDENRKQPYARVLGYPARCLADRLALEMLRQLLDPAGWDIEIAGKEMLIAELVSYVEKTNLPMVCIAALPPGGLPRTRYLCKRLRARYPELKIIVGRWGLKSNVELNKERLCEAGADHVSTMLLETREQMKAWLPVLAQEPSPSHSSTSHS